ncbi:MAG: hydroxyacylglutathione hydrolase [Pseudomonadota bacterium]|nr:hydroxyacylglutathione hydrolase [Pseudomonadota bacterium]
MTQSNIDVQAIPIFNDNYIWIIINVNTKTCVAVDPGDAAPLLAFLESQKLTLEAVLITHHHQDHTGGLDQLHKQISNLNVYGPELESIQGVTHPLEDQQVVKLAAIETVFTIMHTPGHTAGHICYYAEHLGESPSSDQQKPWLFCGDTLFSGGCGRLFEGTPAQMYSSLQRISGLPKNTNICCTHEYTLANLRFANLVDESNSSLKNYITKVENLRRDDQMSLPSNLALELEINPFLRANKPALIAAASRFKGEKLEAGVDTFAALRAWKDVS